MIKGEDSLDRTHLLNRAKRIWKTRFRGVLSANQNVTTAGSFIAVQINDTSTQGYDPLSKWNTTSYYWEVPYNGIYNISAKGKWASLTNNTDSYMTVMINTTERVTQNFRNQMGSAVKYDFTVSSDLSLSTGDQVFLKMQHNNAATAVVPGDTKGNITYLSVHCVALKE